MADDFQRSVQLGLKLSKRIYYGKDPSMKPPQPPPSMEKSSEQESQFLPTSPMVYAVVSDPLVVDNPDIRSYQPYVHGRCNPPALIPLHLYGIEVEVDCYLDMAFVNFTGTWRLHCVDGNRRCDCCLAIPMGDQVIVFFCPLLLLWRNRVHSCTENIFRRKNSFQILFEHIFRKKNSFEKKVHCHSILLHRVEIHANWYLVEW